MPPRRTTRAATSTPTRTLPSAARPSTQDNTPGRPTTLESTPLPDLEAELSFAYGSSNTKPLPLQLVAQKKTTFERMAENFHSHVIVADQNLTAHAAEAGHYGTTSAASRAARAARRSSERESESESKSRADSVGSDQTPAPQIPRRRKGLSTGKTKEWLDDIEEEANSQEGAGDQEEVASQGGAGAQEDGGHQAEVVSQVRSVPLAVLHRSLDRETSPPSPASQFGESTMPDVGRIDQSYAHERGLHSQGTIQPPTDIWAGFLWYVAGVRDFLLILWDRIRRYCSDYSLRGFCLDCCKLFGTVGGVFMLFMVCLVLRSWVCDWYCETPWSISPSRAWHYRVNEMCRSTILEGRSVGNTTDMPSTHASASHVGRLIKEIQHQEKVVYDLQAKQHVTSATIDELTQRQAELLTHQSDLQSRLADAKASQATASARSPRSTWESSYLSPIFKRINYASPGLGAIVDPYNTSPAKNKQFPFYQSLLLNCLGIKKYQSRPPIEALNPWNDIGDCWCAAPSTQRLNHPAGDSHVGTNGENAGHVQLAIMLGHEIFPDEVVVEHLPIMITPFPRTTPKDIEIWGDFSHLNPLDFAALMMGPHGLKEIEFYPQLGLLGRIKYDAVANEQEGKYVQIFRLEYNQDHQDEFWTKKIVVRVKKTYGEQIACLYRVRVHGVPVHPHAGIVLERE